MDRTIWRTGSNTLLGLLVLIVVCGAGRAQTTISTMPAWNGTLAVTSFGQPASIAADTYGQTFTVPAGFPELTDFNLRLGYNFGGGLSFTACIMAWDGKEAIGTVLYQSSATNIDSSAQGLNVIDFPIDSLTLTPGDTYVFFLLAAPGSGGPATAALAVTGDSNSYAGGNFVFTNSNGSISNLSTPWTQTDAASSFGDTVFSATFNPLVATTPPTITFTIPNKHDFDAPFQIAASSNSPGFITYSVITGPASLSGSAVTLTGIGSVTIKASQAASGSYAAGSATATFEVTMGSVFVANSDSTLSEFNLEGLPFDTSVGYQGGGLTISSTAMAFDPNDELWISGAGSGLSVFTNDGVSVFSSALSAGVSGPNGVAADGAGNLWISDDNGRVSEYSNQFHAVSGSLGYLAANLQVLTGVAVDISGNVWIADRDGNQVIELLGAGSPVLPLPIATAKGTPAARP